MDSVLVSACFSLLQTVCLRYIFEVSGLSEDRHLFKEEFGR